MDTGAVATIVRRRLAGPGRFPVAFWWAAALVTGVGLALRLIALERPREGMFDEGYYANEAQALLQRGAEWNREEGTPQYVVHPPLGKWMIALGEQLFGYNAFGWRIMAVLFG